MAKKLAVVLALAMLAIVAWAFFLETNAVSIVVNGQQVPALMKGALGAGGFVIAVIALFCAAIFLAFVFAGIGIVVLGFMVFGGAIIAVLAFPFLLPLLIPLAILWIFIAIARNL